MDDNGLIAAVAGDDNAGLRELFSRHAPWLAPAWPPSCPRPRSRTAAGDVPGGVARRRRLPARRPGLGGRPTAVLTGTALVLPCLAFRGRLCRDRLGCHP